MDEVHTVLNFLKLVKCILPCQLCQQHYTHWLKNHPVKLLGKQNPTEFHEAVKKWLFNLHNTINEQRGIEPMSIEDAMTLYRTMSSKDFQEALDSLLEVLERAKLQRLVDGSHIREWRQCLSFLRRFIMV